MSARQAQPTELSAPSRWRRNIPVAAFVLFAAVVIAGVLYVRTQPLVFNESLWEHAHCIPQASSAFRLYAVDHNGAFPFHANGYGDAMLLLSNYLSGVWYPLSGPGYDERAFLYGSRSNTDVPEEECGRVYIQGLRESSNPDVAILFDKLPSPGGDHCHFPRRLWAPLSREVLFVDGTHRIIQESSWPAFAKQQVEFLIKEGVLPEKAEMYYQEKPKPNRGK